MKKLMYIAAALLVLAGCNNKDNALNNAPEGTPFKKGQQVTLTIGTGDNHQVAPRKVAGRDNGEQIDFTWEEGDQILVKVGDKTAVFELSSEPGLEYGNFTGTMPADGNTFDIQYPVEEPSIVKQVYSTENPIPANKMLFKATGCTLGNDAVLNAQYAMLQLNLYGTDIIVGKIILFNNNMTPVDLTCTGGKKIGATSTEATPFYMIVPAGEYQFTVGVGDNAETPATICLFATSEAKTFVAGKCLNMPAKEVADPNNGHEYVDLGLHSGLKWATMNVGATKPEEYGDYFAWGETKPYYSSQTPLTWKSGKETGYTWQSYCSSTEFVEWSTTPYDATTKILKLEFDAATANWGGNWRMPNDGDWRELINPQYCTWEWTSNYNSTGVAGYTVTSKVNGNSIFLPAAYYYDQCSPVTVNVFGYYWSSFLDENIFGNAYHFYFDSGSKEYKNSNNRYFGCSVRPVCDVRN